MTENRVDGEVEFSFFRLGVRQVFLAGEFNGWNTSSLPMRREPDGWWRCRLRLAPGTYQFRYLADRQWYLDYGAFGMERSALGTWNSVVWVAPPRAQEADAEAEEAAATLSFIREPEKHIAVASGSAA